MLTARITWDETHTIIVQVDTADNNAIYLQLVNNATGDVTLYDVTVHTDNPLE